MLQLCEAILNARAGPFLFPHLSTIRVSHTRNTIAGTIIMAGLGRRTHYRKHLTDSVLHDFPEPQADERIAKIVATRGGNQFDILVAAPVGRSVSSPDGAAASPTTGTATQTKNITSENDKNETEWEYFINNRKPQLALLPTKFRKLVWLKRKDYVIVQTGVDADDVDDDDHHQNDAEAESHAESKENNTTGSIRYIITHILYKEQVKHLRNEGMWPLHDPEFSDPDGARASKNNENSNERGEDPELSPQQADSDGIVYDNFYNGDSEHDEDNEYFVNTNRVAALTIQDDDDEDSSEED